jgi:hypothetical protein
MNDEAERIRCALSLALQFVPLTSVRWDELDRIRRREVIETARAAGQSLKVEG